MEKFGVTVRADSGPGVMHQMTGVIAKHRGNISSIDITSEGPVDARIYFEIDMPESPEGLLEELRALRAKVKAAQTGATGAAATALAEFDGKAAALEGSAGGGHSLGRLTGELGGLYGTLQEADVAPTTQTLAAIAEREATLRELLARWAALRGTELAALDATLRAAGMEEIH